jgi:hypothetical protein
VIDIAHKIITVAVKPVIMCITAMIVAEFFVGPAMQALAAALAYPGGSEHTFF